MDRNMPSRWMTSCRRRSWSPKSSGVKPGTVQGTLRRKCTTAATSKNSTRSAQASRRTASSPAAVAAARARSGLRFRFTGCGPIKKSVSSRLEPAPICWERYVPPGRRTRAISSHSTTTGWRLVTRSNDASAKGSVGASATATRWAPSGRRRAPATATFGGQDSVATSSAGRCASVARTSPPPVCTSRRTRRRRSALPPGGRSPRAGAPRWPGRRTRRSPRLPP